MSGIRWFRSRACGWIYLDDVTLEVVDDAIAAAVLAEHLRTMMMVRARVVETDLGPAALIRGLS